MLEQFEYGLPVIRSDVKELRIETTRDCRGEIKIRNAGGGVLEGHVASNFGALGFTPKNFSGNRVGITYRLDLDEYKMGDAAESSVIIMSNGGELVLPVRVAISASALDCGGGRLLASLTEFAELAKEDPGEAARVFVKKEFADWLNAMGCSYMELYEHFKFDANKERAVENFLVMQRLKKRAVITMPENETNIVLMPGRREAVTGSIALRREEQGFIDAEVVNKDDVPWLTILTPKLGRSSFLEDGAGAIDFAVNSTLAGVSASARVAVKQAAYEELCHKIYVRREPAFWARISKGAFALTDVGSVGITNNTGTDLVVEIAPKHDFVRFEGKRYLIGAKAEIPFEVKLAPGRMSSLAERGELLIKSQVLVKTIYNKMIFAKTLELAVTELKGFV